MTRRPRAPRSGVGVVVLGALLTSLGCGDGETPPARTTHAPATDVPGSDTASGSPAAPSSPAATSSPAAPSDPHEPPGDLVATGDEVPATIARFRGDVLLDRGLVHEGAPLERGVRITVADGAEVVLDLAGGDRATLFGPSLAMIGDGGAQLVLARGSAHLDLPPGPAGPRSPMRVAAREATVELVGAGEIFLVEHPAGASWVVVLSGLARVENGEVDARHHARAIELGAGHALLVAEHAAEPTEGPARLDDARAAAEAIFAPLAVPDAPRRGDGVLRAASDLDSALGWLEAEARHGHELTEQHRAAVTLGHPEEAMRLQGALVGHAQQLHALRDAATARWERLRVRVLAGEVAPGAPDPAEARRERVSALLGFE